MWPDWVSNPGPPTYESGALPIALRGPAVAMDNRCVGAMYNWCVVAMVNWFRDTHLLPLTASVALSHNWYCCCSG